MPQSFITIRGSLQEASIGRIIGTLTESGSEYTTFNFTIDTLSVLEKVSGDQNENKELDQEELNQYEDKIADWLEDSIALEANGREQERELTGIELKEQNGTNMMIVHWRYPAFEAGTTINVNDGLYYNDGNTTYTDLLAATRGEELSQAVLQGKERDWTILLTDMQVDQAQAEAGETPINTTEPEAPSTSTEDAAQTNNSSAESTSSNSAWLSFFKLGMEHILGGYDHLLFLLALLLGRQTFKQTVFTITAFTIAHSITLTLTYLEIIHLPSKLIESVIALNIIYVAFENIFLKKIRFRWAVTFLFGLIHGMGFADILLGMNIPAKYVAIDLASFNIGIEVIQLVLIAIALPILRYLQKYKQYVYSVRAVSVLIALMGAVWLVDRVM